MGVKNVLISGAEVSDVSEGNRGAEHLLRTAAARLRQLGYQPVVSMGKVDKSLMEELDLRSYVGNPRLSMVDPLTPPLTIKRHLTINALHGVLDASGFAMGDAWGVHTATWLNRKYTQWARRGLPVILLPQAFGPFTDPALRREARHALAQCSLIFAREDESYTHLKGLGLDEATCRVAPDITIGERSQSSDPTRGRRFVLVPNWNLAERGGGAAYIQTLTDAVDWAKREGYEPVGLLHEGKKDAAILAQVHERTPIVIEKTVTGWDTKAFIARSEIVLSGRYHAVLAALMTSTPVITHSWSHKYQEVLLQFGVPHWLRDPNDSAETVAGLARAVKDGAPASLIANREGLSAAVEDMWAQVEMVLERA